MSYLTFETGGIIFHDAADKPQNLISLLPADNQSDLPQASLISGVQNDLQKIFNGTFDGMVNGIIFLRIITRLIRKPQVHNVLHVGTWSQLDYVLANTLPQFNAGNFLWNYAPTRPLERFTNVNFIFAEVHGGVCYPSKQIRRAHLFRAKTAAA